MKNITSNIFKIILLLLMLAPVMNANANEPNINDTLSSSAYKVEFPPQTMDFYSNNAQTIVVAIFMAFALFVIVRFWWDNRAESDTADNPNQ